MNDEADAYRQARIVREALMELGVEEKHAAARVFAAFASDETLIKLGRLLKS